MQGLDPLLCRHSQLLVLRCLYRAKESLTGREIERRTGLSNRATMLALESLVEASAVNLDITSTAHWYELNQNHYFVAKALKPAFEAEDLFWDDLRKTVRKIVHPRPLAAVATGPLARDETAFAGRVDLSMVFSTGRARIRAFKSIEELKEGVWDRYAIQIEPILLDVNTMDEEEYDTLWRRVEREGILLFGTLP
ncbi:MAG: hypothetical protein KJ626_15825 [Verrucomicrobia bacterium]|nr:hypothetical protein [Verrucomicrobiota bacterium]